MKEALGYLHELRTAHSPYYIDLMMHVARGLFSRGYGAEIALAGRPVTLHRAHHRRDPRAAESGAEYLYGHFFSPNGAFAAPIAGTLLE